MTKQEIKQFAKKAVNEEFCILFLARNLFKQYENKSDKEILKEFKKF